MLHHSVSAITLILNATQFEWRLIFKVSIKKTISLSPLQKLKNKTIQQLLLLLLL